MHAFTFISMLAAFSTVAFAVPNPRNLVHYRLHGQHIGVPVKDRSIFDGKCGGDAGACGVGYCCSQWGYCGKSDDYCGTGCQSAFGTCNLGKTDGNSPPALAVSDAASVPQKAAHTTSMSAPAPAYTGPLQSTFSAVSLDTLSTIAAKPTTTPPASTPAPVSSSSSGGSGYGDVYKMYTGNGVSGWPTENDWASFESLWNANLRIMKISCAAWNVPNNSDQENDELKSAIQSVASSSGVDARFILAIVMQESKGCVRVITTANSVSNPGLMQSHAGAGSCNSGSVSTPCSSDQITQMIKDGTTGTSSGDGLQQLLGSASGALSYYQAARKYNSGSIAANGDLGIGGTATNCYVSDVANRLTGWVDAATQCH